MAAAQERALHGMFRAAARATPDRPALVSPDPALPPVSYRELDEASDKLAAMLIRHGVGRDKAVGILMERCNEYALAYIAILKAGGAYLPLDPAYPEGLLHDVLENSAPAVVLCKRAFVARMPEAQSVLLLDSAWESCLNTPTDQDRAALAAVDECDLDALAYIVYSSGTTGKPKGIACPHRGAVFSYQWRFANVPYAEEIRAGAPQEVEGCNVFFVWEMLRPLLRGQALCVIPDDVIYDPPALSSFIHKAGVTRMLFTPSLLEAVLDCKSVPQEELSQRLRSLRVVTLCGEVVTVALQERAKQTLPGTRLWNLYSVSECHDVAALDLTDFSYGSRKYCPVGKLFQGVEAVVLDDNLQQRATGEEGELYVAGPTLARCYVGLPELTAQRFPTVDGRRLYKTGDRARVLPNRELEILGRCDSMVKIRGYSVELRAIEAAMMSLTQQVSSCCAVVQGEEGEDKFVIGYLVLRRGPGADDGRGGAPSCRSVRLALKAKLPHYMVPAFLVDMEELPTHAVSGKLNKAALPRIDLASGRVAGRERLMSSENDCTTPRDALETGLHAIWCEEMGLRQVDVVVDSFFDVGGHSLLAAKLVQRIKQDLGHDVGVVDLFGNATIEALANFIRSKVGNGVAKGGDAAAAAAARKVDLRAEVDTFDASEAINDIAMRAFWRSTHFAQVRARSALLTGATGFLGSFLLRELLQNAEMDVVYCVVRAPTPAEALERVRLSLESKALWDDSFAARLRCFNGDASLHHLGLDDDDYAVLSTGVDLVVHAAAVVNLVYPYEGLRAANVVGTRNVIEFALHGKVKKLAHISTNGIFPNESGLRDCPEDADVAPFADQLRDGYGQSKWVAEDLVRRAANRGLPAIIFRPGNMGGVGAAWNPSDLNFLVLTGCLELGAAPEVSGWLMEATPADVAAQALLRIAADNRNLAETFHVTNCGNCLEADEYFDALRGAGYALEPVSLAEWRRRVLASASPSLEKLRNALLGGACADEASLQAQPTFDNSRFAARCAELGIALPRISQSVMHEYAEQWQAAKLVPPPRQSLGRPLAGRVALITGASSGIGAAVARALAAAGAAVGLGGRRLERLETLAAEIDKGKSGESKKARAFACAVDVTDRAQVQRFVDACEEALGPADILVNNAGVMFYTKLEHLEEEHWHKEVDVNVKGLLHCAAAVLPRFRERGRGHFVATSSDAGRKVFPGLSVYSGTKFFVEAFCQGMRLEQAAAGIRVTTVQPGDCKTELAALTTSDEARGEFAQQSQERQFWLDPEDVARAIVFAVSAPPHVGVNEILIEPRGAPA